MDLGLVTTHEIYQFRGARVGMTKVCGLGANFYVYCATMSKSNFLVPIPAYAGMTILNAPMARFIALCSLRIAL